MGDVKIYHELVRRILLKAIIIVVSVTILTSAAMALLLRYGNPLVPVSSIHVIYSEGEDFKSDAVAYKRLFGDDFIFLHFPHARTAPTWWGIDFNKMIISSLNQPRSLLSVRYVLKNDPLGTNIANLPNAKDWNWQFTEAGVSFSGNAFSCRVLR